MKLWGNKTAAPVEPNAPADPDATTALAAAKAETVGSVGVGFASTILKGWAHLLLIVAAFFVIPAIAGLTGFALYGAQQSIARLGYNIFAPTLSAEVACVAADAAANCATTTEAAKAMFLSAVPYVSWAAVGVPAVLAVCMALSVFLSPFNKLNHSAKGIMTIFMVIGLVEVLTMVLYEQAITYKLAVVPAEIAAVGAFVYAAIGGLTLLPVVLVPVISLSSAGDKHSSVADAVADYLKFCGEIVLLLAAIAAEFYFLVAVLKTPAIYATVASCIMGVLWMWSSAKFSDAKKRGDRYDIRLWIRTRTIILVYLALIGALFVVDYTAGAQAALGQASPLAGIMPDWLHQVGKVMSVFVQLISLGLILWTDNQAKRHDDYDGDGRDDATGQPLGWLWRLAVGFANARQDLQVVRDAVMRGVLPKVATRFSLPAPAQSFAKTHDATAEFRVMPDGDEPILVKRLTSGLLKFQDLTNEELHELDDGAYSPAPDHLAAGLQAEISARGKAERNTPSPMPLPSPPPPPPQYETKTYKGLEGTGSDAEFFVDDGWEIVNSVPTGRESNGHTEIVWTLRRLRSQVAPKT